MWQRREGRKGREQARMTKHEQKFVQRTEMLAIYSVTVLHLVARLALVISWTVHVQYYRGTANLASMIGQQVHEVHRYGLFRSSSNCECVHSQISMQLRFKNLIRRCQNPFDGDSNAWHGDVGVIYNEIKIQSTRHP